MLFETAELILQREETKTGLLAGRLAVLAGSVSGSVRDSAFRDSRISYREETKTDLLAGRLIMLARSISDQVRDSAFRDGRIDTPTQKFQKSSFGILEIFKISGKKRRFFKSSLGRLLILIPR